MRGGGGYGDTDLGLDLEADLKAHRPLEEGEGGCWRP